MKKFLGWAAVFIIVVGGGILAFWPVDFWRLYDADWNALALTNAENYCAGAEGMANGFKRDDTRTKDCTKNSARDNETPSITSSSKWACEGVTSTGLFPGGVYDCMRVVEDNNLWLLEGGGITYRWNDQRPRPAPLDEGVLDKKPRGNRSDDIAPSFSNTGEEGEETE